MSSLEALCDIISVCLHHLAMQCRNRREVVAAVEKLEVGLCSLREIVRGVADEVADEGSHRL